MTGSDETRPRSERRLARDCPLRESLLAPLLDAAAATLCRATTAICLPCCRPLAGFDARGLRSGPARQQLHRALDVDPMFRAAGGRAVRRATRGRSRARGVGCAECAVRRVDEAAERSDLPVLASMLFAVRPAGWAFGLGLACAAFDRQRREKERDDDAKARDTQLDHPRRGEAPRRERARRRRSGRSTASRRSSATSGVPAARRS